MLRIKFKVVRDGHDEMPNGFDLSKGTVSRAIAVCPAGKRCRLATDKDIEIFKKAEAYSGGNGD